jgi:hypothetical protein
MAIGNNRLVPAALLALAVVGCGKADVSAGPAADALVAKPQLPAAAVPFQPLNVRLIQPANGKPAMMVFDVVRNLDPAVKVTGFALNYIAYVSQQPAPSPNPGLLPGFQGDVTVCRDNPGSCPTGRFEALATVKLLCTGAFPRNPKKPLICGQQLWPQDMLEIVINWKNEAGVNDSRVFRLYYKPQPN